MGSFWWRQAIPPSHSCCDFSAISLQPQLGTFLHASTQDSKPFLACKKCVHHPQSCWRGLFPSPTRDQQSQLMHSFASTTAPAPGALLAVRAKAEAMSLLGTVWPCWAGKRGEPKPDSTV